MAKVKYNEGQPCEHTGCLNHLTHPCEGCGRIGGKGIIYELEQLDFPCTIEALQHEVKGWEQRYDELDAGHSKLFKAFCGLKQENEQLQAQLTDITKIRDDYATAARVIALYLVDFCDNSMPYDKMIADAARKACMAVEKRDEALKQAREILQDMVDVANVSGSAYLYKRDTGKVIEVIAAIDKIGGREDV